MTTPKEVYQKMIEAWHKSSKASDEWNELNAQIIAREKTYADNVGLGPIIAGDRIRDVKKKAEELKDKFNAYSFWKGEVERHSAMLAGYLAFMEIDRIQSIPEER